MKNWKQWLHIREALYDAEDDNSVDASPDYGNKAKNAVGFHYSTGGTYTRPKANTSAAMAALQKIKQLYPMIKSDQCTDETRRNLMNLCVEFIGNYPNEDQTRKVIVDLHNILAQQLMPA